MTRRFKIASPRESGAPLTGSARSALIIDHAWLSRFGLRQLLSDEFRNMVVEEAGTLAEARGKLGKRPWTVVAVDPVLPGGHGLRVLKEIALKQPDAVLLVLTTDATEYYAKRSLQWTLTERVSKKSSRAELLKVFRGVLSGQHPLPPHIRRQQGNSLNRQELHQELSTREYSVMLSIASGKRIWQIAQEMDVNIKTVSTYKHRLLRKMNLETTVDVAKYVMEKGLF